LPLFIMNELLPLGVRKTNTVSSQRNSDRSDK